MPRFVERGVPGERRQVSDLPPPPEIGAIGDFATTAVGTGFSRAYLVFNTIMNLTTQDEQVRGFATLADQLGPGGRFVVEVEVPALRRRLHSHVSVWRKPT